MSEKTREVPQFSDATYAYTLVSVVYFENGRNRTIMFYRLRSQVGAPLWFSKTVPVKCCREP